MLIFFRSICVFFLLVSHAASQTVTWVVEEDTSNFKPITKFIGGVSDEAGRGGLSDTKMALSNIGDIRAARYTTEARHYYHGILGDSIEAARLIVTDEEGRDYAILLPRRLVFEDLYPRLVDLDSDGRIEVVTLLTDVRAGAAIAVYGLRDGQLTKLAQTQHVGRANRWRNVAGLYDYNGDGTIEIAEVVTPHIGGKLNFWSFTGASLSSIGRGIHGFSNHVIGSRSLELSASADITGDGIVELILPNAKRTGLRMVHVDGRKVVEIGSADLPARVTGNIIAGTFDGRTAFLVPLENEKSVVVHQETAK